MSRIFADACYWIALVNRADELHEAAVAEQNRLQNAQVVTTDEALGEVLNFLSSRGQQLRGLGVAMVDGIRSDPRVTVVEQSRSTFDGGLGRYRRFADKQWSLVDCVSFDLMEREGLTEALTNDHHFEQAGFAALLRASAH